MDNLQHKAEDALSQLYELTRAADEARARELAAAIVVQKHSRGFLVRRRLDHFRHVAIEIQRAWRGYLGRQRAYLAREQRDKGLREAYFGTKATTIQRHWRGFWSRKYLFDFYARKLYLQHVAHINAQIRAEVAEEGERATISQKALAEAAARKAFEAKVGQLHHLVSTTSQPGIFNSPYAIATGATPFIAGAPVEDHLKQVSKQTVKLPRSLRSTTTSASPLDSSGRPTHRPQRPTTTSIAQQQQQQQQYALHKTAPAPGSTFLPPISKAPPNGALDHAKSAAAAALIDAADGGVMGQTNRGLTSISGLGTTNSAGFQVTATYGHGGAGALKQGTAHRKPPPFASSYPAEVEVAGLGVTVPRHTTLRQVVPYDAVQQAERLERKVAHTEMLLKHPLPFSHTVHKGHEPALPVQTSRNLEPYVDPWDPTIGGRTGRFTPTQQKVSPMPFSHYPGKTSYLDLGLTGDVSAPPPFTPSHMPSPPPEHAAGHSSLDANKAAARPARLQAAARLQEGRSWEQ